MPYFPIEWSLHVDLLPLGRLHQQVEVHRIVGRFEVTAKTGNDWTVIEPVSCSILFASDGLENTAPLPGQAVQELTSAHMPHEQFVVSAVGVPRQRGMFEPGEAACKSRPIALILLVAL